MNTLLLSSIQPALETGAHLAALPAAIDPDGSLGTVQRLLTDGAALVKLAGTVAFVAWGVYRMVRAGMAAAAVVGAILVTALALWWIQGGLSDTSDKMDKDLGASARIVPAPTGPHGDLVVTPRPAGPGVPA
ncbi:hypothetical protein [Intrasporangium sp.]|uniref:hypothetical protein n=1 Tax=Intrasporangium sp. TaxID=1925024 RepID=UPI003221F607